MRVLPPHVELKKYDVIQISLRDKRVYSNPLQWGFRANFTLIEKIWYKALNPVQDSGVHNITTHCFYGLKSPE